MEKDDHHDHHEHHHDHDHDHQHNDDNEEHFAEKRQEQKQQQEEEEEDIEIEEDIFRSFSASPSPSPSPSPSLNRLPTSPSSLAIFPAIFTLFALFVVFRLFFQSRLKRLIGSEQDTFSLLADKESSAPRSKFDFQFPERDAYEKQSEEELDRVASENPTTGNEEVDPSILYKKFSDASRKNLCALLLKRALANLEKLYIVLEEKPGVMKLNSKSLLPIQELKAFKQAELSVEEEFAIIKEEAELLKPGWGATIVKQAGEIMAGKKMQEVREKEQKEQERLKKIQEEEAARKKIQDEERKQKQAQQVYEQLMAEEDQKNKGKKKKV